jgi:hypothetical protein
MEQTAVAQFPVLDREAARTHLQYLDPDADEFTFQTYTDSEAGRKTFEINPRTKKPVDPLQRILHGTLDRHWTTLADLSRNGAAVCVTVNKTNLRGRKAEDIVAVRAYFVDFDDVDPETIKATLLLLGLTPHLIVQSSAGRWHAYWMVDGASLEEFRTVQERLNLLMGSDATVKDLTRVMRLAGFVHQKDGAPVSLTKIVHTHDGPNYTNADFQQALTRALTARAPKRSVADGIVAGLRKPALDWSQGFAEGQRNNECARRAGRRFAQGMSEEEALAECLLWNEKNDPPLDEGEVQATVHSIWKKHTRNKANVASDFEAPPLTLESRQFVFDGDASVEPPKMLVKKLLPATGVAFIGGQSSAGKTFIAIALGVSLAGGKDFFDHRIRERVGIAYVAAEGQSVFSHRLAAAKIAAGVKEPIPFAWVGSVPALTTQPGFDAFIAQLRDADRVMQERFGARLGAVFIDTVAACFDMQDENSNAEVARVCSIIRYIGDSIGAVMIPIHHYGKDAATGLRGASAWRGAADVVVSVTCDIDTQSGLVRNRGLAIAKARDGEQGPIAPFLLEPVKLGVDEDGEDFGTCIVKADPERERQDLVRPNVEKGVQVFGDAYRASLGDSEDVLLRKDGPKIRAIELKHIRAKFFATYVTGEGDDKKRQAATRRAWSRVLKKVPSDYATATGQDGREWLWLKSLGRN